MAAAIIQMNADTAVETKLIIFQGLGGEETTQHVTLVMGKTQPKPGLNIQNGMCGEGKALQVY